MQKFRQYAYIKPWAVYKANLCGWADWFESDLVGNREYWSSRNQDFVFVDEHRREKSAVILCWIRKAKGTD